MRTLIPLYHLANFGLLFFLGLNGCTNQDSVAPAITECSELATVRFCPSYGDSPNCKTLHTTLQLANSREGLPAGYHVLPVGPKWQAYQAHQINGQVLRVGYQLGPEVPPNVDGLREATITCLEVSDAVLLDK
ncbi:hypothetical protein [Hymenobacter sublimis]|uniref:Lipoprotein n=1 Tax=Hymenobacter sublimis TaxID=2933777 RepID=A0ABY4J950_9BACT|nr:hypothetical protein [Hymenobacter sublimis]UPL48946.1 hypothetical protein MWH26_17380 [Hymenobacter sublimis]